MSRRRKSLLSVSLLHDLTRPDVLEILQIRPERARPGEDQSQLFWLEVLGEDVVVVRL